MAGAGRKRNDGFLMIEGSELMLAMVWWLGCFRPNPVVNLPIQPMASGLAGDDPLQRDSCSMLNSTLRRVTVPTEMAPSREWACCTL
jgi:hypothetical protein